MMKLGLAFVTAVLLLNLLAGSRGLPVVLNARREFERDEQALARLRAENASLRYEIKRLRDDADAVEEVARRDLGYIAPGEKVFIIRDVTPPDAVVPVTPPASKAPDPSAAP
jgi:cell division protein FtsB